MNFQDEFWKLFKAGELIELYHENSQPINVTESFKNKIDSILVVFQAASGIRLSDSQVSAAKASGLEVAAIGEPSVRSLVERWALVDGLESFAEAIKAAMLPKQHPIEVLQAALEKGVSEGIIQRPSGDVELSKTLSSLDRLLCAAMTVSRKLSERKEQTRLQPVKLDDIAHIPSNDDVLFIDMADQPSCDILSRIVRRELKYEAFCFIGPAPKWVSELIMTGHRVYEIPAGTTIKRGQHALKPHPSSIGRIWLEVMS